LEEDVMNNEHQQESISLWQRYVDLTSDRQT
jgi:hypothetical protein